ncbi:MAG: glutathione S-transferase [Porticoccaceae bacterium]|nr:glutathione S-transferase [Porticoccaceae bacterium]
MALKLWHCSLSRSIRPLWTMEEMGLDYELVCMKFPPRFLHPGYTDINPIGTVPFFTDGFVEMTESSGISQYLVDRYGPTSLSVRPDERDYGLYLNWLHRSDATLTFPQTLVLRYSQLEPEERRHKQVVQDYSQWFYSRLRSLESMVSKREFLCSDRFTIADISVGFALLMAETLGLHEGFKQHTSAYYARLKIRPAYIKACSL